MSHATQRSPSPVMNSPVWLSRHLDGGAGKALLESSSDNLSKNHSADEEDVDTDLETDRLLGHQRLDDQGYYDENKSWDRKPRSSLLSKISPKQQQVPSTKTRNGYNALLSSTPELPPPIPPKSAATLNAAGSGASKLLDLVSSSVGVGLNMQRSTSRSSSERSGKSPSKVTGSDICGMSAAAAAEVVASAVVSGNLPNLGSPNNGGGSERSAPSVIKLDVDVNGSINGGTGLATASTTANATSNAGINVNANPNASNNGSNSNNNNNGIGTNNIAVNNNINGSSNNSNGSNGNATNNNNNTSNSNNNNVAVGSNNGSSGSGAGSNSNSGEKKVKKSKSKEGKCLAWVYPSFNCCNFSVSY